MSGLRYAWHVFTHLRPWRRDGDRYYVWPWTISVSRRAFLSSLPYSPCSLHGWEQGSWALGKKLCGWCFQLRPPRPWTCCFIVGPLDTVERVKEPGVWEFSLCLWPLRFRHINTLKAA